MTQTDTAIKVVRKVAKATGVKGDRLMLSTRGHPEEARARQMVMYILHHPPYNMNFTDIGLALGRYRRTVSHGVNLISVYSSWNPKMARQLRRCAK